MIREDEIREFQDIIDGGFNDDGFEAELEDVENEEEDFAENEEFAELKKESANTTILFVTGIAGLIFFIAVLIGALTYIYFKYDTPATGAINSKVTHSLKIPGIDDSLVTDPIPDGSGKRVKVWCIRTAVPPTPKIGDYSELFSDFWSLCFIVNKLIRSLQMEWTHHYKTDQSYSPI